MAEEEVINAIKNLQKDMDFIKDKVDNISKKIFWINKATDQLLEFKKKKDEEIY